MASGVLRSSSSVSALTPNASQTERSTSGVVVSSTEIPIVSASTTRRFTPRLAAAAATAPALPGTVTRMVSKKLSWTMVAPAAAQTGGQHDRAAVHLLRDRSESGGSVVRRVQAGDDREEHLRGADVARRLLPADVLLACLQREPERGPPVGVDRDPHEAPREAALVLVAHRDERGVRPAEGRAGRRTAATTPPRRRPPAPPPVRRAPARGDRWRRRRAHLGRAVARSTTCDCVAAHSSLVPGAAHRTRRPGRAPPRRR